MLVQQIPPEPVSTSTHLTQPTHYITFTSQEMELPYSLPPPLFQLPPVHSSLVQLTLQDSHQEIPTSSKLLDKMPKVFKDHSQFLLLLTMTSLQLIHNHLIPQESTMSDVDWLETSLNADMTLELPSLTRQHILFWDVLAILQIPMTSNLQILPQHLHLLTPSLQLPCLMPQLVPVSWRAATMVVVKTPNLFSEILSLLPRCKKPESVN